MNPRSKLDKAALEDFHFFLEKINERNLFIRGIIPAYEAPSPALGEGVEYFSSQITLDDRMVYIMNHIVTAPGLSMENKLGNTIISHFYGARGIHSVLTGYQDPDTALVDFDSLAKEQLDYAKTGKIGEYTAWLRGETAKSKAKGLPFWGTTELHTSIMDAGNKFVKRTYSEADAKASGSLAVAEWIASWKNDGMMDRLIESKTLKDMYDNLRSIRGIGPYYGYHCATSNSVNPGLPFNHDEAFCSPGPGAKFTLGKIFPGVSEKEFPMGERVIWIRENQDELFPGLRDKFHPATYNVVSNGIKIFAEDQNELKTYGTEVGLCQCGIYFRLRDNPHLISKRQVARAVTTVPETCDDLSSFFD
jgi:hypothetical protein